MKPTKKNPSNYKDFTPALALADLLPCLFFCGSGLLISRHFPSKVFLIGVILVAAAGFMKVFWKLLLVWAGKNIRFFNRQLRYLMPVGFLLQILALILNRKQVSLPAILAAVTGLPQLLFFLLGIFGMELMVFWAKHNDDSARSNWIEEITNALAQLMFLLGLLFI